MYGAGRLGVHYTDGTDVYEISDHLGNIRATIANNTTDPDISLDVKTFADYYPFGMKMPGKFGGSGYRYAYQGQFTEKDDETGLLSFEARQYDPRIGRWLITDPKFRMYESPYKAMGNNPLKYGDPDGRDIIVLLSSNAVSMGPINAGHMAVIIGNDKDGYSLFSKNGTDSNGGFKGPTHLTSRDHAPDINAYHGNTVAEVLAKANAVRKEGDFPIYDETILFKTDSEQDHRARMEATLQIMEDYNLLWNSCNNTAYRALNAAYYENYSPESLFPNISFWQLNTLYSRPDRKGTVETSGPIYDGIVEE